MHRRHIIPVLRQRRRLLCTAKALFPLLIVTILLLHALRYQRIAYPIVSPSPKPPISEHPTISTKQLEAKSRPLAKQLRRITNAENWRVLGDVQSTGEEIYQDRTHGLLKNEANIAFFLQIAESNILLAPRLLSRIWHPNNVYCIHFDTKISNQQTFLFTEAIRSNPMLSNIMMLPSVPVTYSGISMLLNTLESIHAFLTVSRSWDYYINLSGSDYPLVSVTGMRRLLGRPDVLNSSISFIHFSGRKTFWDETAIHRLGRLHFDLSLGFDGESDEELVETNSMHPVLKPGNLRIRIPKGEAWIIAHRRFCEAAAHGNIARRLITLFANMQSASEHFFQTLAWNQVELNKTVARHSFREILWPQGKKSHQHPSYLDERSSHGSWETWHLLAHSANFFARKFRIPNSNLMDHIDIHKSGATEMMANRTAVFQSFGLVKNRFSCVADIDAPLNKAHVMPCFWREWREKGCREKQQDLCIEGFLDPPR